MQIVTAIVGRSNAPIPYKTSDSTPLRAKGHADAELVSSSNDIVRKHCVDTDSCQRERDHPEYCADIRDQFRLCVLHLNFLIWCLHARNGEIFIDS